MTSYEEMVVKRHEQDILTLTMKNRGFAKKIKSNELEIERIKKYNRDISRRE